MQKEIIIIVAYLAKTLGIGFKGKLCWEHFKLRIKTDMERFTKMTTSHTVIMGRGTWESIPKKFRPLPNRQNIVVSTTLSQSELPEGVLLAITLEEAIGLATGEKIFIIGGEGIYRKAMMLGIANTIQATIVHENFEADCFFPEITKDWILVSSSVHNKDESSNLTIQFVTLKNKKNPYPLRTV